MAFPEDLNGFLSVCSGFDSFALYSVFGTSEFAGGGLWSEAVELRAILAAEDIVSIDGAERQLPVALNAGGTGIYLLDTSESEHGVIRWYESGVLVESYASFRAFFEAGVELMLALAERARAKRQQQA